MHYPKAFAAAASVAYGCTRKQAAIQLSVMHQCTAISSLDESSSLTIENLLRRSAIIRTELYGDSSPSFIFDHAQLAYPKSSYEMKLDDDNRGILKRRNSKSSTAVKRGFCNWLIPQRIMIGQYPGMTPESNGPTSKESQLHIQNMVQDAKITQFCCLQTEVPSQDDTVEWDAVGGEVYLDPMSRREFPRPFTRYGPLAQALSDSSSEVGFLHCPIEDLGTPSCNETLLRLLSDLLHHLESNDANNNALYLHCWGGRGRAGLIGACTASLLFPELTSQEILAWVQGGYDTRAGAEAMHRALRRSPQTEQQREFVREFVTLVKDAKGNLPRSNIRTA